MDSTKLTYSILPSVGRRIAFGDVHGCFRTLMALLNKINATENDQLFFLGDMIDRGPFSELVLDYAINGSKMYNNIFCVRGNHEQFILNIKNELPPEKINTFIAKNNLHFLFDKNFDIKQPYLDFLQNLPFYIELPDYYLVHAGFNFSGNAFEDTDSMLSMRNFKPNSALLNNRRCIIGHTPTELNIILQSVKQKKCVLNIDNGCVYGTRFKNTGNLVCIDLDSNEVFYQINID